MAVTWAQVRGSNYSTMGRNVGAVVHFQDGSAQRVRYAPHTSWRLDDVVSGEPVFLENATDKWERDVDGTMVHSAKVPDHFEMTMGFPSLLLRAFDFWPPNEHDQPRLAGDPTPKPVEVRGRRGWEVSFDDALSGEKPTFVIDAETGIALSWRQGDQWMELEDPRLDDVFEPDTFVWTGPALERDSPTVRAQREHMERERAVAGMPHALPTWLPVTIAASPRSGDPRSGALTLSVTGQSAYFELRRWVTAIGEPALDWPADQVPARHRQSAGEWTYEIRSHQEMDPADCARIVDSIEPVDPPDRSSDDIVAEFAAEEAVRRDAEVRESLGTGRALADHLHGGGSLLIRTDFTDDAAWREIATAAMAPIPQGGDLEFQADLTCIDNRDNDGLTVEALLSLVADPPPYYAFMVDSVTVSEDDHPILVVDCGPEEPERPRGRTFRVVPGEMHSVENNLSLANMDFDDFADSAGKDGVFRGFPEPVARVTAAELAEIVAGKVDTDTLRAFHEEASRSHYPYVIDLHEADLGDVHERMATTDYDDAVTYVGFDDYFAATERGGSALVGVLPLRVGGWWTFLLEPSTMAPIAAMLTEPPAPPPAASDAPQPQTVTIPYDPPDWISLSSLTDDDDLVDREAVTRAVRDVAIAKYGENFVSGGEPALLRIPNVPGFSIGCIVTVGDTPVGFAAIVTDTPGEFIVLEAPPEGLRVVGPSG